MATKLEGGKALVAELGLPYNQKEQNENFTYVVLGIKIG